MRDGSKPIRVTLVWTDSPHMIQSTYQVRNDLTLGGYQGLCLPCRYGNNIANDGPSAGFSTTGQVRDNRNNVEQILFPPGTYSTGTALRIFVVGDNITADGLVPDGPTPRQDFALVIENAY